MPFEYIFKDPDGDNEKTRHCLLKHKNCIGKNKQGKICTRKMYIGTNYCWQHLAEYKFLKIKKSGIPNAGKGLFAWNPKTAADRTPVFKKDQLITIYEGENISNAQKNRLYGNKTAPYAVQIKNDFHVDAACLRSVGSLANRSLSGQPNNSKFFIDTKSKIIRIKATKNIYHGQEIFVAYSNSYKINQPRTSSQTRRTVKYRDNPVSEELSPII